MCLAIYRPANATGRITEKDLRNALERGNNDAFGYMWPEQGMLHLWKSANKADFGLFVEGVEELQDRNVPLAVHLRFATHGGNDELNAHPIEVLPGRSGIIHNGIISSLTTESASKLSDTALFARRLRQMPRNWHRNAVLLDLLERFLGAGNKVVFMQGNGDVVLLNSRAGHWNGGIWWSNDNYVEIDWTDYTERWKYPARQRSSTARDTVIPHSRVFGMSQSEWTALDEETKQAIMDDAWSHAAEAKRDDIKKEEEEEEAGEEDIAAVLLDGGDMLCPQCYDEERTPPNVLQLVTWSEIAAENLACDLCGIPLTPTATPAPHIVAAPVPASTLITPDNNEAMASLLMAVSRELCAGGRAVPVEEIVAEAQRRALVPEMGCCDGD